MRKLRSDFRFLRPTSAESPRMPSVFDVLASSINIMQVRITRSRMAGDPPDVIISPRLAHLALLDFHRADIAIEAGQQAVQASLPALDRKSTRLNSSHVKISYAVFCLKKKKQKTETQ